MSLQQARNVLKLVERDKQFAAQIASVKNRDELITQLVQQAKARGIDVTVEDVSRALDEATPPYEVLWMGGR